MNNVTMNIKNIICIGFSAVFLLYFASIGVDVMDIDAAQYASMCREMLENNSFLQIYDLQYDYLDKPPLLFWLGSWSIKIFGINNFAYKLPSILTAIFAVFCTYKFSRLIFNVSISVLAALILATCQAWFLITNDIRTDTILAACVIFSFWKLQAAFTDNRDGKNMNFFLAFVGIGLGLLAKGPVAIVVPVISYSLFFLYKKEYSHFFRWQYLVGIIIILIILAPMSYGLYQQFDLHPEKNLYDKTNISGLRFFYWTQSFGRITGESEWNNGANISFLFVNMLWSFMPWILFFVVGIFSNLKAILEKKDTKRDKNKILPFIAFVATYLCLGSSKYQLPHYIFVVFPMAAIFTAQIIWEMTEEKKFTLTNKYIHIIQYILLLAIVVLCFTIINFIFISDAYFWNIFIVLATVGLYFLWKLPNIWSDYKVVYLSIYVIFTFNILMTFHFYPQLLTYQMGNNLGRYICEKRIPVDKTYIIDSPRSHSLCFYGKHIFPFAALQDSVAKSGNYIIVDANAYLKLQNKTENYELINSFSEYRVTMLNWEFLNPSTRKNKLETYYLLKIL